MNEKYFVTQFLIFIMTFLMFIIFEFFETIEVEKFLLPYGIDVLIKIKLTKEVSYTFFLKDF